MRISWLVSFLILGCCTPASSQTDSVQKLEEVYIRAPFIRTQLLRAPVSIEIITTGDLQNHSSASLLNAVNIVAGVRMEERSPGSYRLSIRGSLLRSPFGIRNIKVYADEFSLTDAGGNTYLNLLDAGAAGTIEILKGPASSIFGANTGGAVLIDLGDKNENAIKLSGGSFGLFQEQAQINIPGEKVSVNFYQAFQRSDGYRDHSGLNRKYAHAVPEWRYSPKGKLKALLFYSDLFYETPGGLTFAQSLQNPGAARPATPTLPGAIAQRAGIFNTSVFTGLSHTYNFNSQWSHIVAVQYLNTAFKNPFITNYEVRNENNVGLRTYITYKNEVKSPVRFDLGLEWGSARSDINNSTNNLGVKGTLIAEDALKAGQGFGFTRLQAQLGSKLFAETSVSVNFYNYRYASFFPTAKAEKNKSLPAQVMPEIAASYLLAPNLAIRGSVSRGYSPPTIAEIRASDNQVNTNLKAEHGYNIEGGIRLNTTRMRLDASVFSFKLRDAIVRRVNANDTEYFINAGGTNQQGVEIQGSFRILSENTGRFVSGLKINSSYALSNFRFSDYIVNNQNVSGFRITGVPKHALQLSAEINISDVVSAFFQYGRTSSIWLNDQHTAEARPYELGEAKINFRLIKNDGFSMSIFTGAENIFNERYSAGNDLNAANGRFFNPAPSSNYYGGISARF